MSKIVLVSMGKIEEITGRPFPQTVHIANDRGKLN
jgi:hypothetical protein